MYFTSASHSPRSLSNIRRSLEVTVKIDEAAEIEIAAIVEDRVHQADTEALEDLDAREM